MSAAPPTALQYPCLFPIKAMGKATETFNALIVGIVRHHAVDLSKESVEVRYSAAGKYMTVTATILAKNREQLDAIYRDLVACEHVLFAL